MYKVTVIVPIYNAQKDVNLCLQSLVKNINYNICDVICVDDCSEPETADFVSKFCQEAFFKYLRNDENLGFVKTCNRGIKLATGDIVVLLNSDTIIPENFCEKIIKCFESDDNIGVASPIASHSGMYYIKKPLRYTLDESNALIEKYHIAEYPDIFNAEGFCFCIRKLVIENLGYLDEIYGFGYCEEVDYAHRVQSQGYRCVLIDDLYVYHKRHSSFGVERREKQLSINEKIFKSRWQEFENNIRISYKNNPCRSIEKKVFYRNSLFNIIEYDKKFVIKCCGMRISIRKK